MTNMQILAMDRTGETGEPIFRAPSVGCSGKPEALHTFLDAAAAEGLVLNGVDAADLYIEIFPERYAAAIATN
jgi:hypothetical protein